MEYLVRWEVTVTATNVKEAAEKARVIQTQPDTRGCLDFDVCEPMTLPPDGESWVRVATVDLGHPQLEPTLYWDSQGNLVPEGFTTLDIG